MIYLKESKSRLYTCLRNIGLLHIIKIMSNCLSFQQSRHVISYLRKGNNLKLQDNHALQYSYQLIIICFYKFHQLE